MSKHACIAAIVFFACFVTSGNAWAHKPSDSYLTLSVTSERIDARWDLALRDLEYALHIDENGDGNITWGELERERPRIEAYAFSRLSVRGDGVECTKVPGDERVVEHSDGSYAVLRFSLTCHESPRNIAVSYNLLFDLDPQHRGLLDLVTPDNARTAIFTISSRDQTFELAASGKTASFTSAIRDGITHIWQGIDHLLFLLALLLPSVMTRENGQWKPVTSFRPAFRDVLGIVTAFTIAHSITLSLAALDVVRLPSRIVESGIAASVVLAALNNLYPVLRGERWSAAFALGLLHGFGFSAVLVDLGLPRSQLVGVLFGFNVGVEIGQFAVVAAFLPVAYFTRSQPIYRRVGLIGGSAVIALVATIWFVERAFAVKLIS